MTQDKITSQEQLDSEMDRLMEFMKGRGFGPGESVAMFQMMEQIMMVAFDQAHREKDAAGILYDWDKLSSYVEKTQKNAVIIGD